MKKSDLTRQIARESHLTQAAAADQLDRIVHELLERVRKGYPAELPGLGTFIPGLNGKLGFEAPYRMKKGRKP